MNGLAKAAALTCALLLPVSGADAAAAPIVIPLTQNSAVIGGETVTGNDAIAAKLRALAAGGGRREVLVDLSRAADIRAVTNLLAAAKGAGLTVDYAVGPPER